MAASPDCDQVFCKVGAEADMRADRYGDPFEMADRERAVLNSLNQR